MRKTRVTEIEDPLQRARWKLEQCTKGILLKLTPDESGAYLVVLYDLKASVLLHRRAFVSSLDSIGTRTEVGWETSPNAAGAGRSVAVLEQMKRGRVTELYTPEDVQALLDYERELDGHIGFLASLQE